MNYLQNRKKRAGFLLLMTAVVIVWPVLKEHNWDVKEWAIYLASLLLPGIPLWLARERIVKGLQKHCGILDSKWVRFIAIATVVIWLGLRSQPVVQGIAQGEICLLFRLYFSFLPLMGIYLFSIEERIVPGLIIAAVLISDWSPVAGGLLSLCTGMVVIPDRYPLSLQKLQKMEVPEDVECACLCYFVEMERKQRIIPGLEEYIAHHKGSPFWGYHYLLHYSHRLEGREKYEKRVHEAEEVLIMDEISILFPELRFKVPSVE